MALRDGWSITTDEDGDRLFFQLVNGSPYQVEPDFEDPESLMITALEPGYYDDDLNPVDADEAVAPEEGQACT